MALLLDGVNQYAVSELAASFSSAIDHSFFCWVKSSQSLSYAPFFGLHGNGAGYKMVALRRDDNDFIDGRYRPNTIEVKATSTEKVTSEYKKCLAVWDESAGQMSIYVDSATPVTSSGSPDDITVVYLAIGCQFGAASGGTPNAFLGGSVAHPAYWKGVALTGADVADLMSGAKKPDELTVAPTHYKPLVSDQTGGIGADYTLYNSPTIDSEDPYSATPSDNIDTDNNVDQFQRNVALNHSLASPLTSVLINNVEHIDLIQNSDAELKYIKRCYDAIGSDVTSVVLKNGVDADVTIPSVTVNTTHPYPVPNEPVDSNSIFSGVTVSGDNAAFRITSQPTKGTLDLSDPAKYLHDVDASKGGVYTPNAGATGTDSFTFEVHDPDEPVEINRTQSGTVTINIVEGVVVSVAVSTSTNNAARAFFISQVGSAYKSFNNLARAYYKSVTNINSNQFNDLLRAAQKAVGFVGKWPGDRGN